MQGTNESPTHQIRLNYSTCPNGTLDLRTPCRSTAIDVFSRYLLAYPLTDASAVNEAKALIDIMTKQAYLPTTLITDKGTAFTSMIIAEITQILGITLKCATTKHPQTIGKLERTHASLKPNLKMACGEYRR